MIVVRLMVLLLYMSAYNIVAILASSRPHACRHHSVLCTVITGEE